MEFKKRKCLTIDDQTEELIGRILQVIDYRTTSEMFRSLVEKEAVRLNILPNKTGKKLEDEKEITVLEDKLALAINVMRAADDKAYILLDCINNLMNFLEVGGEFKSASSADAHQFVKISRENLEDEKHIARLDKY